MRAKMREKKKKNNEEINDSYMKKIKLTDATNILLEPLATGTLKFHDICEIVVACLVKVSIFVQCKAGPWNCHRTRCPANVSNTDSSLGAAGPNIPLVDSSNLMTCSPSPSQTDEIFDKIVFRLEIKCPIS
jgi:hypothetical protein